MRTTTKRATALVPIGFREKVKHQHASAASVHIRRCRIKPITEPSLPPPSVPTGGTYSAAETHGNPMLLEIISIPASSAVGRIVETAAALEDNTTRRRGVAVYPDLRSARPLHSKSRVSYLKWVVTLPSIFGSTWERRDRSLISL